MAQGEATFDIYRESDIEVVASCVCVCARAHIHACFKILFDFVLNQIPEALGYVRQALQLQGDDANSLHLLALLLSAQKHYHDALNIIDMALSEYPENFM